MVRALIALVMTLTFCLVSTAASAAEWQWSAEIQPSDGNAKGGSARAFLWIPPDCQRVRGVVFGQHNMEEEAVLEHAAFRKALSEIGFAAVWVAPGFDAHFRFDQGAGERFDGMMRALADASGYGELTTAPLVPVGHSAAASMPWYIAAWKPERVLAGISFSGQWPYVIDEKNAPHVAGRSMDSVPGIVTMGEYEWADENLPKGAKMRAEHPQMPLSALGCPADGHFAAMDEKVEFLAFYLKKAVAYRLPESTPDGETPKLKTIDPTTMGWLADRYRLNKDPMAPAAPVGQYKGDPAQAFWYFDEETAKAVEAFQAKHRGKGALVGYVQDGKIVEQKNGTHQQVTMNVRPDASDGITFKLTGAFLDAVPEGRPARWVSKKAGESIDKPTGGPPIEIRRITGPIKKISDDTWRLDFYRESFLGDRRGNDAWLVAIWPGDGTYKRAVQQSLLKIPSRNDKGADQVITFPPIGDQKAGTATVNLTATSDANVPVRYYVREGPAEISEDGKLTFTPIPPRSKFPMKVTVVAWQWGRSAEPLLKSAEPVVQTLNIVNGSGGQAETTSVMVAPAVPAATALKSVNENLETASDRARR